MTSCIHFLHHCIAITNQFGCDLTSPANRSQPTNWWRLTAHLQYTGTGGGSGQRSDRTNARPPAPKTQTPPHTLPEAIIHRGRAHAHLRSNVHNVCNYVRGRSLRHGVPVSTDETYLSCPISVPVCPHYLNIAGHLSPAQARQRYQKPAPPLRHARRPRPDNHKQIATN